MSTTYTLSGQISSISRFLQQAATGVFNVTYSGSPSRDFERLFVSSELAYLFIGTYSVTTSPTSIDVTSLTDNFGQAISFNTVKQLQIVNNDTTHNLTVGGGTNALFAALPVLVGQSPVTAGNGSNGSAINLTTNLTVSSTVKIITLVASAGTISVDVFIVGN